MTMPAGLLASMILLLIGCASTERAKPAVEQFSSACKPDEFSGIGVGASEGEALGEAHSALAKQINSSVKVTTERMVSQQMSGRNENLSSMYESKTTMESSLPNAHDARVASKKQDGNRMHIAVCMAKADAARGFIERQRLVADSLDLVAHVLLNTGHPKRKNEAWNKTQMLWNEFIRIQNLLEDWGAKPLASKTETMEKATDDYKSYCQNTKIHWEDTGNECSNAVFAKLSKKASMEKSACTDGFRLRFSCEEKCESLSFGVECSFEPSLAVESCGGERYSLLRAAKPVTGSDMHNKSNAMRNLIDNLPKAVFFEQWEKEIREWVPQCAD